MIQKTIYLLFLVNLAHGYSVPQFTCIKDFSSPGAAPVSKAMRKVAYKISDQHQDFAESVAHGRCLNLPETSVFTVAGYSVRNLPEECLGITIGAFKKADLKDKALAALNTQSDVMDGENGSAILHINGRVVRVPICMESFEGGGPQ